MIRLHVHFGMSSLLLEMNRPRKRSDLLCPKKSSNSQQTILNDWIISHQLDVGLSGLCLWPDGPNNWVVGQKRPTFLTQWLPKIFHSILLLFTSIYLGDLRRSKILPLHSDCGGPEDFAKFIQIFIALGQLKLGASCKGMGSRLVESCTWLEFHGWHQPQPHNRHSYRCGCPGTATNELGEFFLWTNST